jgi:hypothetical protein
MHLETAARDAKDATSLAVVASVDDDGAPVDAEVVVSCPLCKPLRLLHKYRVGA